VLANTAIVLHGGMGDGPGGEGGEIGSPELQTVSGMDVNSANTLVIRGNGNGLLNSCELVSLQEIGTIQISDNGIISIINL
jgi:hypothetical protein